MCETKTSNKTSTYTQINYTQIKSYNQSLLSDIHEKEDVSTFPSNFFVFVKTTVLAGMLIPMEKVSVANKHFINPSCRFKEVKKEWKKKEESILNNKN